MGNVTMKDLLDGLNTLTDLIGSLEQRVSKIETAKPSNGKGRTNGKTKKVLKPTTKTASSFLAEARKLSIPVAHEKYRKVAAFYSFDNGRNWVIKEFWGKKKMDRHDWAMYKLHGEFLKATSQPNTGTVN